MFAFLVIVPVAAYPQASITGVVKDTSGAVLPGVTVEAASPALIERTRSVLTSEKEHRRQHRAAGNHVWRTNESTRSARW